MSSLRAFRFQKSKPSYPGIVAVCIVISEFICCRTWNQWISDERPWQKFWQWRHWTFCKSLIFTWKPKLILLLKFQSKRPRLLSDDESQTPVKSGNGYGFGGMPSPDVVQSRLDLLQHAFPNKVIVSCESKANFSSPVFRIEWISRMLWSLAIGTPKKPLARSEVKFNLTSSQSPPKRLPFPRKKVIVLCYSYLSITWQTLRQVSSNDAWLWLAVAVNG